MCINRDESAPEPKSVQDSWSHPVAICFMTSNNHDITASGAYIGPVEDIKLLLRETDRTGTIEVSPIPRVHVGTVIEGALKCHRKVYLIRAVGLKSDSGHPIFDFRLVSHREVILGDWWTIPLWVARFLRIDWTDDGPDGLDMSRYSLRG